jgi:hypothetical protein
MEVFSISLHGLSFPSFPSSCGGMGLTAR